MEEALQKHAMTEETMDTYLDYEKTKGLSAGCLRSRRCHLRNLYRFLPEEKEVTADIIAAWKESLEERYTHTTAESHLKTMNYYLEYHGYEALAQRKHCREDLTGREFGELTVLELTGKKDHRNLVWKCRCSCGKETEVTTARLMSGNTSSCGCVKARRLEATNMYYGGTSLRRSLADKKESRYSASGYTGVTRRGDKWTAYIYYRGKRYYLGCYRELEDAVKARARAKALVQEDAERLLAMYEQGEEAEPAVKISRLQMDI